MRLIEALARTLRRPGRLLQVELLALIRDQCHRRATPHPAATEPGSAPGHDEPDQAHDSKRAELTSNYSCPGGGQRLLTCSQSASSADCAAGMYRAPGNCRAGGVKLPRATSRS